MKRRLPGTRYHNQADMFVVFLDELGKSCKLLLHNDVNKKKLENIHIYTVYVCMHVQGMDNLFTFFGILFNWFPNLHTDHFKVSNKK